MINQRKLNGTRERSTQHERWISNFNFRQSHRGRANNARVRILFYQDGLRNIPRARVIVRKQNTCMVKLGVITFLTAMRRNVGRGCAL